MENQNKNKQRRTVKINGVRIVNAENKKDIAPPPKDPVTLQGKLADVWGEYGEYR